jgi:ribonuclease P protein component
MMKFTRQSRLLKPAEFKLVFQQATRSSDEYFRMLARPNKLQHHRLGLAISKKTCTKAVGRNRIKRIVRESFRDWMAGPVFDSTLDIVVMSTAATADHSNQGLNEALTAHWQRLTRKAGNRRDQLRTQR